MKAWFIDTGRHPRGSRAALDRMVAELATGHGVTVAELHGPSRIKRIVNIRQAIMAEVYATDRWSLITVGRALNRDHTTVLHAVKKLRALAQQEAA